MSEASNLIQFVYDRVIAHNGTILDLSDPGRISLIFNVDEVTSNIQSSFKLGNDPYTQLVAPFPRIVKQWEAFSEMALDFTLQIFFRPTESIGANDSMAVAKFKQDVAKECRSIIDDIQRYQMNNGSDPDFWFSENPVQQSIEKSTLYSEPDEAFPPYMSVINFTIHFNEVY